jgi:hypothetical protein
MAHELVLNNGLKLDQIVNKSGSGVVIDGINITTLNSTVQGKIDKITPAANGNIALLNLDGSLSDSTVLLSDLATSDHNHDGTYEPANSNIQTHIETITGNPHSVTKDEVGLGNVTNDAQIPLTQKGAANGVAELNAEGLVPTSQLPSYVDDVLEFADLASLPTTGETGKIYVTQDDNLTYRWSGTDYVEISKSLALGETDNTAYRGDRGKIAYDHSQVVTGNPHSVTKDEVGLGNVPNVNFQNSWSMNTGQTLDTDNVESTDGTLNLTGNTGVVITSTTNNISISGANAVTFDGAAPELGVATNMGTNDKSLSTKKYVDDSISAAIPKTITNIDIAGNGIVIDSFDGTIINACRFDVQIMNGTNMRMESVLVIYNGTNATFSTYSTNDLGNTTDVEINVNNNSGTVQLTVDAATGGWTIKTAKYTI